MMCLQVRYTIQSEDEFREQHKEHLTKPRKFSAEDSLFARPPQLTDVEAPADDTRTAKLVFDDPAMAAGHFPELPALPVAVLAQAAYSTLPLHGKAYETVTVMQGKLTCVRLFMLGETVKLVSKRAADGRKFSITALDEAGSKVASIVCTALPRTAAVEQQ